MSNGKEEDFFHTFFRLSGSGQYALDIERQHFIAVNPTFCRLTGYTEEEFLSGEVKPERLVAPEDAHLLKMLNDPSMRRRVIRTEMRLVQKSGRKRFCEIIVHNITLNGRRVRIGCVFDITKRKNLQKQLERQIELQRKRAMEVAKASLRIYQLTEKLRNVPRLATALLVRESEKEMFECAVSFLTDRFAFNYKDAVFYIRYGNKLVPMGVKGRSLSIHSSHRVAALYRGEKARQRRGEVLVPLIGRRRTVGVMRVTFEPEEFALFEKDSAIRSEQYHLLETIADIVAMAFVNLRLYKKVARQSIIDELTGVFNRRYLERFLRHETERARRYRRPLSIVMLDLDGLKKVNDELGHSAGDKVLKRVATLMSRATRTTDAVCRIGGDEFIVVMPETSLSDAFSKAEKLLSSLRNDTSTILQDEMRVTASAGVAEFRPDETTKQLFERADAALYKAKQKGRDRAEVAE